MTRPYRTNVRDVPLVDGLREDEGWIEMQVQFLIDEQSAGTDQLVFGRTVIPPGGRHDRHRHFNCDEFLLVLTGSGEIYTDEGRPADFNAVCDGTTARNGLYGEGIINATAAVSGR